MSFSKRAFSALSTLRRRSTEQRTLGAIPSRRFFSACSIRESSSRRRTKALELRHFFKRRLPRRRLVSENKIGDNGRIQFISFVAIAGAAGVVFDASWVQ